MPEQNNIPEDSNNISAQKTNPAPSATPVAPNPVAPPITSPVVVAAPPSPAPVADSVPKTFIVSPTPVIPATPPEPKKPFYQKKDLFIAGAIGFVCALLILPIAENLAINLSYSYALIILLPFFSALGMWAASWLAQKLKVIYQVAKFILVGLLNTFVDWGILNLLMFLTSTVSGPLFPVFKGISFLVATSNSYAWNKFWTFRPAAEVVRPFDASPNSDENATSTVIDVKDSGNIGTGTAKEFLQFFIVSVIGFTLNVGIATLIVNVLGAPIGISEQLWANVGALGGTLIGLAWNFLGYKLIVFKS